MSIRIPISADFDPSQVEQQLQQFRQQLNALGQQIAQANKVQFNPIGKTTVEDMRRVIQQFEALKRVSGDLNKRINATGQGGSGFFDLDWSRMYPDQRSRSRQMAKAFEYVTGVGVHAPIPPSNPPRQPHRPPSVGGIAAGVAQAGLRGMNGVTGGAGGVAANALGTGMSAGFGAGLMGLMGGLLALGVGKAVSSITENIGRAENNSIGLDKLKRTIGDVSVSFEALKKAVYGSADAMGITYEDAGRYASQYAKLGNLSGKAGLSELPAELQTSVGLSRAFGLDPSQGVGVLGQMRGLGVTKNEQDTRRFALLIGETIGKSGAFAKSDEVMDAISGYMTAQARNTLGAGNAAGYAGLFAGMVGSGIPGLDPAGAGGLLSRINASLAAGGAKGEASQFFTARLGASRGMDVFDTQLWREGGAFSTAGGTFDGNGSVARFYRKYGLQPPGGGESVLAATMQQLKQDYGSSPKMMLQATANHMGLSMSQAAALHVVDPQVLGDMERFGNVKDFNASGISNLAKALGGTAEDRQAMVNEFLGRTGSGALSKDDRGALQANRGDDAQLRELLGRLSVKYGQEETAGSIARDSKALLDNIKVAIADRLVPMTNEMRLGILSIAGAGRGRSTQDIMRSVIDADANARIGKINSHYDTEIGKLQQARDGHSSQISENGIIESIAGLSGNKALAEKAANSSKEHAARIEELDKQIAALREEQKKRIEAENDARKRETEQMERDIKQRQDAEEQMRTAVGAGGATGRSSYNFGSSGGGRSSGGSLNTSSLDDRLAAAERANGLPPGTLRAVMQQETGGDQSYLQDPTKYHYGLDANGRRIAPHTGCVSTAFGPFGILESTGRSPGYGVSPLKDKGIDEQIRFAGEYLGARVKSAGSLAGGLAGYGEGYGYSRSVISKMGAGTPMPADAAASRAGDQYMNIRGGFDPLTITLQTADGRQAAPPQTVSPRFGPATPFGR